MPLNITNGSTVSKPNGEGFLDEYAGHIETLYETGSRPLTAVGGTGNVVTATMAVDLTAAGLVDGLCVSITWGAANTGPVTLAINGGSAIPVVDAAGTALTPDTLAADLTSILRYTAGEWRIMSSLGTAGTGSGPSFETITASVTWDRPTGYADDTMVRIQLWGAGGGGGRGSRGPLNAGGGGGGGGAYTELWMRIADIPTSVLITIGAGGNGNTTAGSGAVGGNTTFGSLATAYGGGGGGGGGNGSGGGGGGGGELAAGTSGSLNTNGNGGALGGGAGGAANQPGTLWAGGGGSSTTVGGISVFGGGGGAGATNTSFAGGTSVFGGAGGASGFGATSGSPGVAPGGGGGGNGSGGTGAGAGVGGNGARGECRITIFG